MNKILYEFFSIFFLILSFSISKYDLFGLNDKLSFIISIILLILSIAFYLVGRFKNKD